MLSTKELCIVLWSQLAFHRWKASVPHCTELELDTHVCYKSMHRMRLSPTLKPFHCLCFKFLNHYNSLFARNERAKHLHTSRDACSIPCPHCGKDPLRFPIMHTDCCGVHSKAAQWARWHIAGLWTARESPELCKVDFSCSWKICICRS